MTYEIYRYIFICAAIAAVVMLALAIILYVKLYIAKAVGELTGSTRRKALKEKEGHGLETDTAPQLVTTATITQSGSLIPGKAQPLSSEKAQKTTKLATSEIANNSTAVSTQAAVNTPPSQVKATTVLTQEHSPSIKATTILTNQTSNSPSTFEVEIDITFIHTNEMIS
jgi:hypothetical protein